MTAMEDSVSLFIVAIIAVHHLNRTVYEPWCLRVGFALVIGGSVGGALEWWWPNLRDYEYWSDTILHIGMASVALGMARDDVDAAMRPVARRVAAAMRAVIGRG
jgi:hypothetical protein